MWMRRVWTGDSSDGPDSDSIHQESQASSPVPEMTQDSTDWQQKYEEVAREQARVAAEFAQYREATESLQRETAHHYDQLISQERQLSKQDDTIAQISKQAHNLYYEKNKLAAELQQKSKQIATLEGQLSKQRQTTESWKQHSDAFATRVQELGGELEEAKKKTDSAKSQLHAIQLEAVKQAQSTWKDVEDGKVRDASDSLFAKIRAWAKKYSASSLKEPLSNLGPSLRELLQSLRVVSDLPEEELVSFKHPFLIVAALVSEHLRCHLLNGPFVLLSYNGNNGALTHDGRHLNSVFLKLMEVDMPNAHKMRTQLLRIYFPKSQLGQLGSDPSLIHSSVPSKVYREVTTKFLDSFHPLLNCDRVGKQQCFEDLLRIFSEGGVLSNHLATQRIEYLWLNPAPLLGKQFSVNSKSAKADRLNRLDDDEDEKCNGQPMRILLSPPLSAFGNSEGEDYNKRRVLTKAIVWVDDREQDEELWEDEEL